jgi:hypothetical protein
VLIWREKVEEVGFDGVSVCLSVECLRLEARADLIGRLRSFVRV